VGQGSPFAQGSFPSKRAATLPQFAGLRFPLNVGLSQA